MDDLRLLVYLLPVLFIIHDLEELVFAPAWMRRHAAELAVRFPFAAKIIGHLGSMTTPAFAVAVLEEFVILSAVTLIAVQTGNLTVWYCCFLAFSAHLVVHIFQCAAVGAYTPAVATSVLCLPYSVWGIVLTKNLFSAEETLLYGAAGILVAGINLFFIHAVSGKISKVISR